MSTNGLGPGLLGPVSAINSMTADPEFISLVDDDQLGGLQPQASDDVPDPESPPSWTLDDTSAPVAEGQIDGKVNAGLTEGGGHPYQVAEIYMADPQKRAQMAKLINGLAAGQFAFDDRGFLVRTQPDGAGPGKSKIYSGLLDAGIASPNRLNTDIRQTYVDTIGKTHDVDGADPGGGVTQFFPGSPAISIVSGHSQTTSATDQQGRFIFQRPEDVTMHELGTHGIPYILAKPGQPPGNAIIDENRIRSEIGLPLRQSNPNHPEYYDKKSDFNP